MSQDAYKQRAAEAAIEFVESGSVIGVGTGSTVNHFIEALGRMRQRIDGAVSSSEASTQRLKALGVSVLDLNTVGTLPLYVDGADESNAHLQLIKGGGGELSREKIVAAASERFVCFADDAKLVNVLGAFPLPIEVIPMAQSLVARELVARGGRPVLRTGFVTDNGNIILDAHDLKILQPARLESDLNDIPGVVTVGLFAKRPADVLLLGGSGGVRQMRTD